MPSYKSKNVRGCWTQESLETAFKDVAEGSSVRNASKIHKIPEKTLRDRLKKRNAIKGKLGQPPALGLDAEKKIVLHVKRLQAAGYAPTRDSLCRMAFNLAEQMGRVASAHFNEEKRKAGKGWLNAFLNRNPTLSIRKAQGVSMARADGMVKEEVNDYFNLLNKTLESLNILNKPGNIYNVDESGLQLNNPPKEVIAAKGSKSVQVRQSKEQGETVTVVACCNAEGSFLPPYVVFKGVYRQQVWLDNMPNGSEVVMGGKSAYINEVLFKNWLGNHFIPRKAAGPCLLLLDGHGSHTNSPDILEIALANDVHFLCLPSHTTHYLQPLDRSFFKPLKAYYRNAAIEWGNANPGKKLERRHFGQLLQKAWSQAATMSTGSVGFRACGVFPFAPSSIPEYAYLQGAPDSKSTDIGDESSKTDSSALDPQPSTSGSLGTPNKQPTVPHSLKTTKATPTKLLEIVSPVPKCDASAVVKNKQHAQLLTTPENIEAKKAKRAIKIAKQEKKSKFRKPAKKQIILEEELPSSSGGEWDEKSSVDEDVDEEDFLERVESVKDHDYVLVEFPSGKNRVLYYVGIVLNTNIDGVEVKFMKKGKVQFVFPQAEDISVVKMEQIKKVMPVPNVRRGHFNFQLRFPKTMTVV